MRLKMRNTRSECSEAINDGYEIVFPFDEKFLPASKYAFTYPLAIF